MATDNLSHLAAFAAVARHRSFRKAGGELTLSTSAVSYAIRALEERLGVGLFHRTTRSVALTEAGQRLLDRLQPALGQVHDALEEMNQFRDSPTGLLRINAARSAVPNQLGPRLTRFLRAHPDVRLELTENDGLVDIVAEGFDAGVRLHEFVPEDMVAVPLGRSLHGMIVASPEYLRQHPAPQHPRDLLQHECIRFRFASGHLYKWQFDRDGQSLEIDVRGRLTLSEQTTIIRAVLDGFGLAYVLEDAARPHIEAGTMVAVLQDWSEPFPGFVLYYPKQRQMASALRAFVDMLRE
ncbi:TPA: LysR family transcriptional regulator [Stenotrophomonas maltophilia]|uniref:LysR family transcriptional regulator n=1 Tax=Stenotrophomonas TaxID=40323 RepID=UPI0028A7F49E|nr:LysR family transcriptional regulator [Stenotrophomonas sp.]HDS0950959.1 LysR family transcriptional regulator [Stenotrophomonas maltophilia]HDS1027291.1 LysR family transcriptional regulator [Stenotrophomonas maltophilia]HDS1031229.1 LysR family transcriptional regulator [Stenotrophomonas maltophilia]HDS1036091.1 LysR family transcriptional regulator [Stenotrophomonas maltophilia]HDS1040326.1 LysR family transcriptional regulator [Stenotrophomonas maltophilia]